MSLQNKETLECPPVKWIRNWILPNVDPTMSSLGHLGAKMIPEKRKMGIYCDYCVFCGGDGDGDGGIVVGGVVN